MCGFAVTTVSVVQSTKLFQCGTFSCKNCLSEIIVGDKGKWWSAAIESTSESSKALIICCLWVGPMTQVSFPGKAHSQQHLVLLHQIYLPFVLQLMFTQLGPCPLGVLLSTGSLEQQYHPMATHFSMGCLQYLHKVSAVSINPLTAASGCLFKCSVRAVPFLAFSCDGGEGPA